VGSKEGLDIGNHRLMEKKGKKQIKIAQNTDSSLSLSSPLFFLSFLQTSSANPEIAEPTMSASKVCE